MDKENIQAEFNKAPEEIIDPQKADMKKKDRVELLLEQFKDITGLDVDLKKNNRYKIKKIIEFLDEEYEFRYNLFAKKPEFRFKKIAESEYEYFEERDFDNLFNKIEYDAGIQIGTSRLSSLIGSDLVSVDYDPIKEYINGLPKWDGKDRFPMFLTQVQLIDDSNDRDHLIKYFTKWFTTMVASLVSKDVINEASIVFTGKEGRGKTRFFLSLIPQELQLKYFFSGSFNPRDKDHFEMLGTKILIFLDEMATITRTDSETLKSIMSQRHVVLRRAYGRGNIHLYRRASFAGAINDDRFLIDTGANRRWLPFAIERIEIDDTFNIGKLYAQSLAMFKDGFNLWYDETEIDEIRKRNYNFKRRSPEEELIMLHYMPAKPDEIKEKTGVQFVTASEIAYSLSNMDQYKKMNVNDSVIRRIGKIMVDLEFTQMKVRLERYQQPRDCYAVMAKTSMAIESIKKAIEENKFENDPF